MKASMRQKASGEGFQSGCVGGRKTDRNDIGRMGYILSSGVKLGCSAHTPSSSLLTNASISQRPWSSLCAFMRHSTGGGGMVVVADTAGAERGALISSANALPP